MMYIKKFLKRISGNKRASGGFSIGEMLVAVLILLLASEIIARSIGLASEGFFNSTNKSEAQLICSTLSDFVRSELTTAGELRISGGSLVSFLDESGRVGGRCKLEVQSDGKLAMVNLTDNTKFYYPVKGKDGAYADGLKIKRFSCDTTDGGKTFTVNIIIIDKNEKELAESNFVVVPFAGRPQ